MNKELFELIKQVYTESREVERLKIANYFEKRGFKVKKRGSAGKGVKKPQLCKGVLETSTTFVISTILYSENEQSSEYMKRGRSYMITCYLRYIIDPYKVTEFEQYSRMWIPLVNRLGGTH